MSKTSQSTENLTIFTNPVLLYCSIEKTANKAKPSNNQVIANQRLNIVILATQQVDSCYLKTILKLEKQQLQLQLQNNTSLE